MIYRARSEVQGVEVAEQEGRASWCPGEFHVTLVRENCCPGRPAQTGAGFCPWAVLGRCSRTYSASDFKHRYPCLQHSPL